MAELTKRDRVYAEQVRQLYQLSRPAYVGALILADGFVIPERIASATCQ